MEVVTFFCSCLLMWMNTFVGAKVVLANDDKIAVFIHFKHTSTTGRQTIYNNCWFAQFLFLLLSGKMPVLSYILF